MAFKKLGAIVKSELKIRSSKGEKDSKLSLI